MDLLKSLSPASMLRGTDGLTYLQGTVMQFGGFGIVVAAVVAEWNFWTIPKIICGILLFAYGARCTWIAHSNMEIEEQRDWNDGLMRSEILKLTLAKERLAVKKLELEVLVLERGQ